MTDARPVPSAAAMCRVYAAANMSVTWSPQKLREFAALLDESERLRNDLVVQASREVRRARMGFAATVLLNLAMLGVWLNV